MQCRKSAFGVGDSPHIIAEIGANHDGSVATAHNMIDAIAATGAKLVKFQLYNTEELVADRHRLVRWGPPGHQREEAVGVMFDRLTLDRSVFPELFAHARELGQVPFATPFCEDGVDFLMGLDVAMFKIASSDVTHLPLLRHAAGTGKPVVLSLGKSTLAEAAEAVDTLRDAGCEDLALLHCVASYPSPIEEMNLRILGTLKAVFPGCMIGLSEHSQGIVASLAAIALGAEIVERHVTLDRDAEGPDHWFSLTMEELAQLVDGGRQVKAALGSPQKHILACEAAGRTNATRSLIASRDLEAGTVLETKDIKIVRPGTGIQPRHVDTVVGMRLTYSVSANTPLQWSMFQSNSEVNLK